MRPLSSNLRRGILNLPGITHESKVLVQKLLVKDYVSHHIFFNKIGLHNHLNHHLLAAYDLGAPPALLQAIYDSEATSQRPLIPKEAPPGTDKLEVTIENWTQHLGDSNAYAAYLSFFSDQIAEAGVAATIERYVFDPSANGNGAHMLGRLISGAFHPMIVVGYGAEFSDPIPVAEGLSSAAVHSPNTVLPLLNLPLYSSVPSHTHTNGTSSTSDNRRQPSTGASLLSVMQKVYESTKLVPVMPYDNNALLSTRIRDFNNGDRPAEVAKLCSEWTIALPSSSDPAALVVFDADLESRVEECVWLATLLTFATGKRGRKPRLDFFLMHCLTSSLFLEPLLSALKNPQSKVELLQGWLRGVVQVVILRGRPRIDAELVMSYTEYPRPPNGGSTGVKASKDAIGFSHGDAKEQGEIRNPWHQMISSVVHAPDSHTVKAMRTLIFGSLRYGTTPPGGVIGAFDYGGENETLTGAAKLDGSLFVRAAGMLMDTLGWLDYGQKEGSWDRSALGWDAAWDDGR